VGCRARDPHRLGRSFRSSVGVAARDRNKLARAHLVARRMRSSSCAVEAPFGWLAALHERTAEKSLRRLLRCKLRVALASPGRSRPETHYTIAPGQSWRGNADRPTATIGLAVIARFVLAPPSRREAKPTRAYRLPAKTERAQADLVIGLARSAASASRCARPLPLLRVGNSGDARLVERDIFRIAALVRKRRAHNTPRDAGEGRDVLGVVPGV